LTGHVFCQGEITTEEVPGATSDHDLFLFCSTYEAMPMALEEALAEGMGSIASEIRSG
jgi:glycosyltransferase involved in cell wall biosynthesis